MKTTQKMETAPVIGVRRFKMEDAPKIFKIIQTCLDNVNSKDYPDEVIDYMKKYLSIEKILNDSKDRMIIVAHEDNSVRGSLTISGNEVSEVFVDPRFHGSGIGNKLMQKAEEIIRKAGFTSIFLKSSITAIGFYKKLGFIEIGKNEDAQFGKTVSMTKEFTS